MFCSFCGNPVPNNAKHCPQCGKKLPVINETNNNLSDTKSNFATSIENLVSKMQNMKILIITTVIIGISYTVAYFFIGIIPKIDIIVKILQPVAIALYICVLWKTPKLSKNCADVIKEDKIKKKSITAGFLAKICLYFITPIGLALDVWGLYFQKNFYTHLGKIFSLHFSAAEIAICIAYIVSIIGLNLSLILFWRFFKIKKVIYNTFKEN